VAVHDGRVVGLSLGRNNLTGPSPPVRDAIEGRGVYKEVVVNTQRSLPKRRGASHRAEVANKGVPPETEDRT
jgi:hypothetical protein